MPGAEERGRVAAGDQGGGDANRGSRLAPQRRRRILVHRHGFARIDDANAIAIDVNRLGAPRHFPFEHAGRAHQRDADVEVARRPERTIDDGVRRMIAAHRVERDGDGGGQGPGPCGRRTRPSQTELSGAVTSRPS